MSNPRSRARGRRIAGVSKWIAGKGQSVPDFGDEIAEIKEAILHVIRSGEEIKKLDEAIGDATRRGDTHIRSGGESKKLVEARKDATRKFDWRDYEPLWNLLRTLDDTDYPICKLVSDALSKLKADDREKLKGGPLDTIKDLAVFAVRSRFPSPKLPKNIRRTEEPARAR